MEVGFTITFAISSTPAHNEVSSIHYVIKFVRDLRQLLWFSPPIKLTVTM